MWMGDRPAFLWLTRMLESRLCGACYAWCRGQFDLEIEKRTSLAVIKTGWQEPDSVESMGWDRIPRYISPRGDIIFIILDEQ